MKRIIRQRIVMQKSQVVALEFSFTNRLCGDAGNQRKVFYVFGNDGTRGADSAFPNTYAGQNGAVCVHFGVFADLHPLIRSFHVIALGVPVRKNLCILGNHRAVAELNAPFGVDIAALIPGNVFADLNKMTVIKSASLVGKEPLSATFKKMLCYDLPKRDGERAVDPKRALIDDLPQNMHVPLFLRVRALFPFRQIIAP